MARTGNQPVKTKGPLGKRAIEHDTSECKGESKNGHHQWGGAHHESKVHGYECKNNGCKAKGHFDPELGSIMVGEPDED